MRGKRLQLVISTGAPDSSYTTSGHNRFTMAELIRPLEVTAHLCGLDLVEPLVLHSAHRVTPERLAVHAARYRGLLSDMPASAGYTLNEIVPRRQ